MPKPIVIPDFDSWDEAAKTRFCIESFLKITEQKDQIEQLRQDLRDAMNELRRVIRA